MGKKDNHSDVKLVLTETDLRRQVKRECGKINIRGDLAKSIAKKYDSDNKLNNASNVAIILGLVWAPVLIAGVAGKLLTTNLFVRH